MGLYTVVSVLLAFFRKLFKCCEQSLDVMPMREKAVITVSGHGSKSLVDELNELRTKRGQRWIEFFRDVCEVMRNA